VILVDGTHDAAPLLFVGNVFELTTAGTSVVIVIPTFLNASGAWLTLDQSNVTISNVVLHHTYNYGEWNDLSLSSALIEVGDDSNLVINSVAFIPDDQSETYANPVVLGTGSGSSVDIRYSTFINMSLTRVSLCHSFENPELYFTNISFRYGEHFFFSIIIIIIIISNISSSDFSYGAIYSTDLLPSDYHFTFQNCTFEGIVSDATAGGAISAHAIALRQPAVILTPRRTRMGVARPVSVSRMRALQSARIITFLVKEMILAIVSPCLAIIACQAEVVRCRVVWGVRW
jgi:hypothetical protein